ncbi:MAG: BMP family lipoprotein [Spirochaetota bacterium]
MKLQGVMKPMLAVVLLVAVTAVGFAGGEQEQEGGQEQEQQAQSDVQVAIVFATGGLGDQAFNDSAFRGIQQAEEELGISYQYAEPQAIADYEGFLNQFAASGRYDLIISIGFDQADALSEVASEYTEQRFAIVDTAVEADNVASFVYREPERGFLVGAAAALTTADPDDEMTNPAKRIGMVGGMEIPIIDGNIAGYIAGAKYVDPEVEVSHAYVGDWADPARGKEIAISMIEDDVDVIWGAAGRSGLGVIDAAEEADVYAIGADSDQSSVAPEHVLTNGMKFVDETVMIAVEQIVNGDFQAGVNALGVAEGALGYTESLLSDDVIAELEQIRQAIVDGEVEIPSTIEEARSM